MPDFGHFDEPKQEQTDVYGATYDIYTKFPIPFQLFQIIVGQAGTCCHDKASFSFLRENII